ncbi:MAG: ABC transporter ATP-binding protein [Bacillota bacterium]|nr:ABC transporter ATP-binding protein [Candidatus Fermentithermobacillaceae bacterium]HHT85295.1 ABC transporter ATP-binding protein [Candidatus Fermentithermobacillaceae bacterium]
MKTGESILTVDNLSVSFRTYSGIVKAVRGVSFELNKGETICIVGESGSGKSVTVKTIMGILPPSAVIESGTINYKGMDLTKLTEEEYARIRGKEIGLIFQDPLSSLNPLMKIGRQITEALLIDKEMSKREAREAAIELLGAVGIRDPEQRFEQYPFQFSGGMRQRVVIAIALARNPEVLICDEPTTALDVTVQARILNLINELKQKRQLSIIFITHDLGVVAHMADRVYVMYAGKIVEYGTAEDIFLEPAHPYARALLASVPDMETEGRLASIPGAPPNMLHPPTGDGFAPRNKYAMQIDFEEEPPMFRISDTHYAATWSLHPSAPEIPMPDVLRERIRRMKEGGANR